MGIKSTAVIRRTHHHPGAIVAQRDRLAKTVAVSQRHINIVAAAVAHPDRTHLGSRRKRVAKAKKMHRTRTVMTIAVSVIAVCTHCQLSCIAAQRHRPAKPVVIVQPHRQIACTAVARAQGAGLGTGGKASTKSKQMHGTALIAVAVGRSLVVRRTHCQARAVQIQRHRLAKVVRAVQRHRQVVAPAVSMAQRRSQGPAAKGSVCERQQTYRTRICAPVVGTVVTGCTHCQCFAVPAQRNRAPKVVIYLQTEVHILATAVARADRAGQLCAAKIAVSKADQMHSTHATLQRSAAHSNVIGQAHGQQAGVTA